MATRIIEYGGRDRNDGLPIIPIGIVSQTPLTASGTSQQSAAFNAATSFICVDTDETVHVHRGTNPTATTANRKVRAGSVEFFSVSPGQMIAIIAGS